MQARFILILPFGWRTGSLVGAAKRGSRGSGSCTAFDGCIFRGEV